MRSAMGGLRASGMRVPGMHAAPFPLPWSPRVMVDGRAAGSRPSVEYRGSSLPVALPYHRSPAMPKAVSRMLMLLCTLVAPLPVGTNLGLLHLLWMLVSGRLLAARGAVIPGLDACRLSRQALLRPAVPRSAADEVLVCAAAFPLAVLQEESAQRFVVRVATHATFRRATPPAYRGRGRPPTRGTVVRPLPRTYHGRPLAATPPDAALSWEEEDVQLRAEAGRELVLPTPGPGAPRLTVVALYDPRYRDP